jgi:hypothetical protein
MSQAVIDRKVALLAVPSHSAQSAIEAGLKPATRNRKGVPEEAFRYKFDLAEFLLVYASKTRESSA